MYMCFAAEDKLAAFQSFTSRRPVFLHGFSGIWMHIYRGWLSLMNQHPIGGLIVSKQNWAVKQQWKWASVHDLRHDDPLRQPVYHVFCFHRNGIQATKETCLGSKSVRMCKSVQETLSEKVSYSFKGLLKSEPRIMWIWNKTADHKVC